MQQPDLTSNYASDKILTLFISINYKGSNNETFCQLINSRVKS